MGLRLGLGLWDWEVRAYDYVIRVYGYGIRVVELGLVLMLKLSYLYSHAAPET